jgi:hypothetical protein
VDTISSRQAGISAISQGFPGKLTTSAHARLVMGCAHRDFGAGC